MKTKTPKFLTVYKHLITGMQGTIVAMNEKTGRVWMLLPDHCCYTFESFNNVFTEVRKKK